MLYPLPPPPFPATDIKVTPRNVVGVPESPLTLQQQAYQWPGQRWEIEAKFPPMPRVKAEMLIGWLTALQGRLGTFCFGDISANLGQGLFTKFGQPVVTSGAQVLNAGRFNTLMMQAGFANGNYPKAFAPGDYLQVGGLNALSDSRGGANMGVVDAGGGTWAGLSQTDPYGLALGAGRVTTYGVGKRLSASFGDSLLVGGMLSIWIRASIASSWTIQATFSQDSLVTGTSYISVAANVWTRLMLPLTYEAIQDYLGVVPYTLIPNKPSVLTLVSTPGASSITKTGATGWNGAWAYASTPFTNGIDAIFTPQQTTVEIMAGFCFAPLNLDYPNLDFAWNPRNTGQAYVYIGGGPAPGASGPFTYAAGASFEITYDGNNVLFYLNGVLQYTYAAGPGLRLWFGAAISQTGGVLNNIAVQPVSSLTQDIRGMSFDTLILKGNQNAATVDLGAVCYDPTGGLEYNATNPTTAVAPQGYAHLYKAQSQGDYLGYGGGVGVCTLPQWPRLRLAYPNAQRVRTTHAKGVFRLANEHDWTIDRARIYGLTLKAIESL